MEDEKPTTESKLDMQRVQRWAELLEGDPQAREFMRERIAGSELTQLSALSQRSRRLELALQHGIPAQLAEVHLTAEDPALLEQQAESLAALLHNTVDTRVGADALSARGPVDPARAGTGPAPTQHNPVPVSTLPAYESAPINREEWLEQQFVRVYEH
jgi:hypothetical protein